MTLNTRSVSFTGSRRIRQVKIKSGPQPASCEELLRAMVGFDTVNGHISGRRQAEAKLSCYLEELAATMGFRTARLPVGDSGFNLLVTHEGGADKPWLLFESHLDTVSVADMTIEPFAAMLSGGRIYGRGACDTKGSGAAMLWALGQYVACGERPNNVAVLFTLDEEIGKTGIRAFVDDLPSLGFRPFGAIVGEPTEMLPVTAHNGLVRWSLRTRGVAAHSADPSKGRSAIRLMCDVIREIEEKYIARLKASHPLTGKAQCSINVIRGGTQINIIPESCEIQVDRRIVPGEDPLEATPALQRLLDGLSMQNPQMDATIEPWMIDWPLDPVGAGEFIGWVQRVLDGAGVSFEAKGAGYATEASDLARSGIPSVVLGPGSVAQAHTHDEWLDLRQLELATNVYERLMRCPSGRGGGPT